MHSLTLPWPMLDRATILRAVTASTDRRLLVAGLVTIGLLTLLRRKTKTPAQ